MIIQGYNNITAIYGKSQKPVIERQSMPAATANLTDRVSISDAAKSLSSETQNLSQTSSDQATGSRGGTHLLWQSGVIDTAREFPAWGEKFAHDFAYDDGYQTNGPLVDITNYPTMRYTYTGELVTDKNLAEFKAEAAIARTERIALYEAEKADGTADPEIIEKLFRLTDSRSDSYLNIVGWERATNHSSTAEKNAIAADTQRQHATQ
ncbi:hypothetical protein [Azonexus sp.]|uniref:hypothetical protein n=1 Tax=Azonexus sp. TaxID=1872668 RepID=UPI0027BA9439|nr:hypothetical protein [Azonexus sp.]